MTNTVKLEQMITVLLILLANHRLDDHETVLMNLDAISRRKRPASSADWKTVGDVFLKLAHIVGLANKVKGCHMLGYACLSQADDLERAEQKQAAKKPITGYS